MLSSLSCVRLFGNPIDYTVHGILQARILEWVVFPLLQGIVPTQELNPGLPAGREELCRNPACKELQADSLSAEPPGKPWCLIKSTIENKENNLWWGYNL